MTTLPAILAQPYSDHAAMAVLSRLDPMDQQEADLTRGWRASHLELFADWRGINAGRLLSLVLSVGPKAAPIPFAVLGLSHTGQGGVASAAMLGRSHERFSRALIAACLLIRTEMPKFCADNGIHRIEARSWSQHPRANRFLRGCGFHHEATLPGYGPEGRHTFCQFAWTQTPIEKED